ncbi:MAG: hypothetical protein KAI79_16695, partial [Bacteroidales bacterium]|nr:hypothetical protein [Bacteroidales bacterium]
KEIQNNIQKYYKKANSLLITVDDYGDFKLSKTGEFINKVEILHNKLEINHKHSFELLLKHQIGNDVLQVEDIKTNININVIKKKLKEDKLTEMNVILDNMKPIEYEDSIIEEYKLRNYIVTKKDKMLKIMANVKSNLRDDAGVSIVKEITKLEINKKFKFISELKRLKLYLTKNEDGVKQLLSFIVSENTINKTQIQYFKYVMALKKHNITLRSRVTQNEINKVNEIIGFGDFKPFLRKIGYKKRGNVYTLDENYIKYSKYIK